MHGHGSVEGAGPPEPRAGDDLVAQLARWSAGERVAEAARSRSRERSLRDQAASSATWAGTLVDLAERRSAVTALVGAVRLKGTLEAVCSDFCVLARSGRRPVLVRLAGLRAIWPDAPADRLPPAGSRFPPLELSLAAALSMLAEDRAPVTVRLAEGQEVTGELVGVGEDVATVRGTDGRRRSVLVRLDAVEYCELR